MFEIGIDLYREICCALGTEATAEHHRASSIASGSRWTGGKLANIFRMLNQVSLSTIVVPQCRFLHFGATLQLITSGLLLSDHDDPWPPRYTTLMSWIERDLTTLIPWIERHLSANNRITAEGRILGKVGWVEGCRLSAPLRLAGMNIVVGVNIDEPLDLPAGACLDVIAGKTRVDRQVWFVAHTTLATRSRTP